MHVHEADTTGGVARNNIGSARMGSVAALAQGPDVVDDVRTQIQHMLHDFWLGRVNRYRNAEGEGPLDHRQQARKLLLKWQ